MTAPVDAHGLEETVRAELRAANIPGCSLVVVDRDRIRTSFGVGLADLRSGRPATADTVYHLYSGTKLYTATAVMQLVESGDIALDAPAGTWLPEILGGSAVTVLQLLNHTSGLADTMRGFVAVHGELDEPPSTAAALARYRIRQRRQPGSRVEYRNVNYALLGEIVSRVSGVPYATFVDQHILRPLRMPAAFTPTAAMRASAATGYMSAWEPLRWLTPLLLPRMRDRLFGRRVGGLVELRPINLDTAAIGGLVGTAAAFAPFVRAQLGDGAGILTEDGIRRMQTWTARGAAGIMSRLGTGLGWKIGTVDGVTFLNHEGGGPGFTSETRLYPAIGLGIVLCMNRWIMPRRSHLVAHRICEAVRRASHGAES